MDPLHEAGYWLSNIINTVTWSWNASCTQNHVNPRRTELNSHLLTTLTLHHIFTVPFQAQNSPFPQIFSTIVSLHPPGLPARTILDRTYSAQRFSIFSLFFSFYFRSCGTLSWLNCQLSSAR